jgi:hypothetical protein
MSNAYATAEACWRRPTRTLVIAAIVGVVGIAWPAAAQPQQSPEPAATTSRTQRAATLGLFVAGGAIGLAAHESGHLFFDVLFDADPGIRRVDFHGIPFFAITHRRDLSPAKEFTISSAGFWVQHLGNEWLLIKHPRLRHERAPLLKGMFAFNVLASGAYAVAAFFETGPEERDTRGMAVSSNIEEPWIGVMILAPAVFDSWRYFRPESRAAVWMSRIAKVGGVLLTVRAANRSSRN